MKIIYTTLALVLLCCVQAVAQPTMVGKINRSGAALVIPYTEYKYPNGLTLLVTEDHSDPLVHVDVTYHVGSAREEIGKSGFAHFFEHMMFQGSDNVADEQHFKIITESGGTLNGTTNRDRTNYFETVPANQLEKMLWLEADRMGFLLDAVTQQKFEVQRATVKNERGQRYDNVPYGLVGEVAGKNLYPYGHPYSWLTIGYVEDLNRVNVQDLKNFFLRWYGPNNAVITVGGAVSHEEVSKLVDKYFGSIPRGPEVAAVTMPSVVLPEDRYVTMIDDYAKLPMLQMTFSSSPQYSEDEPALDCLAAIMGKGKTSLLYKNLLKPKKAVQANIYNRTSELSGEFTIRVVPYPGIRLKDIEEQIRASIDEFGEKGATEDDVQRFVAQYESSTIFGLESVAGKVSSLASYYTFTGDANYLPTLLERYRALKPEDVMRVYNKYIKGQHAQVLSVVTASDTANTAGDSKYVADTAGYVPPSYGYEGLKYTKAKDSFDRSIMPLSKGEIAIQAPDFWKEKIGVTSYIGADINEIPAITVLLKFKGGKLSDPEDKQGLSSLFADMMEEDTKLSKAEDFERKLELLGSSISVYNSLDGIDVSVRMLSKNLDKTMILLEERLLSPNFTQEAFDRVQAQAIERYKNSLNRPSTVAGNVMDMLLYPNSPVGRLAGGNDKTLKNITLKDVATYYAQKFSRNEAQVIIVGDVDKNKILSALNFWDRLPANAVQLPDPKAAPMHLPTQRPKQRLYLVDIPGAAQTEFRIGQNTGLKYDALGDYYKSGIMNYPLGGVFNSRLNLTLREDKGWTYGARSSYAGSRYAGSFIFSAGIRADATDSALALVMDIVNDYRDVGATQSELDFTRSSKIQSEARAYETGMQKAGYLGQILEYGLPKDFSIKQKNILNAISLTEINALAKAKLPKQSDFIILLVGDKAQLSAATLEKYDVVLLDKEGKKI